MRSALVYGLVFGIAPLHVGYAAVMAVPAVERLGVWWAFYLAAGIYLWALALDCLGTATPDPVVRQRTLLLRWYLRPIAILALLHALAVLVTACGPEWESLVRAAAPPSASADLRPGEISPPPGGPPQEIGPFLGAGLELIACTVRAVLIFLYRLWLGTPVWLFVLSACVAWVVTPAKKAR